MAWFKVDDQLWAHPKFEGVPLSAVGLWVKAGSYCAMFETDGALTPHRVRTLGAQKRDAEALVRADLWRKTSCGYEFKNWAEYQPTKAQKDAERKATAERVKEHRKRKRNAVTPPVSNADVQLPRPDPTRETSNDVSLESGANDETTPSSEVQKAPAKADATPKKNSRGTRLPESWAPDTSLVEWTNTEIAGSSINPSRELERFRDYWTSQPGSKGTRKNWDAVWRNWIRRAIDDAAKGYRNQDQIRRDMFAKADAATQARIGNPLALIQGGTA